MITRISASSKESLLDNSKRYHVIIPEGVETIGYHAFRGCTSLEKVIIPEDVETIAGWTFKGCTSLKKVIIHEV